MTITLDRKQLLGYRLGGTSESGSKIGQKAGTKIGGKAGVKVGLKPTAKMGPKLGTKNT